MSGRGAAGGDEPAASRRPQEETSVEDDSVTLDIDDSVIGQETVVGHD